MSGCLSVFRLQPQANLQWNKIGKNGISTRVHVFSENVSVNPLTLCVVRVDADYIIGLIALLMCQ
jgi:hypothetical protein